MYLYSFIIILNLIQISVNCEYDNGTIDEVEFASRKWPLDRFEDLYIFTGDNINLHDVHSSPSSLLTSDVKTLTLVVITESRSSFLPNLTPTIQVPSLISAEINPSLDITSSSLSSVHQPSPQANDGLSRSPLFNINSTRELNSFQIYSSLSKLTSSSQLPSLDNKDSSFNVDRNLRTTLFEPSHTEASLDFFSKNVSKSDSMSLTFKPSVTLEPSFYITTLSSVSLAVDTITIRPISSSFMVNATAALAPVVGRLDLINNSTKCQKNLTKNAQISGFLVRSVLNRKDVPTDLKNITQVLESRLKKVFDTAYQRHMSRLGMDSQAESLANSSVHLWNIFWNNFTNELHIVYQVEKNGEKLKNEDVKMILSHITKQEMTNILGSNVSTKAESYIDTDSTRSKVKFASKLFNSDWFALFMLLLSLIILLICLILTLLLAHKKRKLKRNLSISINEISKIKPKEQLINWRKVSGSGEYKSRFSKDKSATVDSNHEFEYVSFDSPHDSFKIKSRSDLKTSLKSVQSELRLNKEKVIQVGKIVDYQIDTNRSQESTKSKITYVTTKETEIGDYSQDHNVPELLHIQINQQTESIIKAIKSELKKFNPIVTYTLDDNSSQA